MGETLDYLNNGGGSGGSMDVGYHVCRTDKKGNQLMGFQTFYYDSEYWAYKKCEKLRKQYPDLFFDVFVETIEY